MHLYLQLNNVTNTSDNVIINTAQLIFIMFEYINTTLRRTLYNNNGNNNNNGHICITN